MQIIIHRGTNQIGGCLTEIVSNMGTKILVDIGANLPDAEGKVKPEIELEGLTKGESTFDAIFITHYHGDHVGLYNKVNSDIQIYMGKISKGIYTILQKRLNMADLVSKEDLEKIESFNTFKIKDKIKIKDIVVTPIATDHSAFDSYMFLIEAAGKKILHTGDFRTHGQRGKAVFKAIEKYVGKIDCLICEGTTLTRENAKVLTEFELQREAENIFKINKYNFVLCSSTNIDRIAGLHKATLNIHKMFIVDRYQCDVLEYVSKNSRSKLYKFNEGADTKVYCYGKNMLKKMTECGFVMLVRPNDRFKSIMNLFEDKKFIYSQWLGYLKGENKDHKRIQNFVPHDFEYLHTSGHATPNAIKDIIELTDPNVVIPIHTEDKKKILELTDKAVILEDKEIYVI